MRKKWILGSGAVLVIAGFIGAATWRWNRVFSPPPTRDLAAEYLTLEHGLSQVPFDKVTWDDLLQLTDEFAALEDGILSGKLDEFKFYPPGEEDRLRAEAELELIYGATIADDAYDWVEQSRKALRAYAASVLHSRLTTLLGSKSIRVPSIAAPDGLYSGPGYQIGVLNGLARVEAERLRLALQEGDSIAALDCVANILELGRTIGSGAHPATASEPVQYANLAAIALREHLEREPLPVGFAADAAALFDGLSSDAVAQALLSLQAQEILLQDAINRVYAGDTDAYGAPETSKLLWVPHREMALEASAFVAAWSEYLQAGPVAPEPDVEKRLREKGGAANLYDPILMNMFRLESLVHRTFAAETELTAMAALLAIYAYHESLGELPSSLDVLVRGGFLKSLPEDRHAWDGEFRYRLDETSPAGFVLYSVGRDHEDDGGTEACGVPWADLYRSLGIGLGQDSVYSRMHKGAEPNEEWVP